MLDRDVACANVWEQGENRERHRLEDCERKEAMTKTLG